MDDLDDLDHDDRVDTVSLPRADRRTTKTTTVEEVQDVGELDANAPPTSIQTALRASLLVLPWIVAVAFRAGLVTVFDQLWRWNNIVAPVLSVLLILGLVVAVPCVWCARPRTSPGL